MTYIAEFVMAHGAGQGIDSDFMIKVQALFEEQQILCRQFNFDYMERAISEGKRRPPDGMAKLQTQFNNEIAKSSKGSAGRLPLFIGGKSMGGRVASLILEGSPALAAVCFGYPFHPPGKPEKLRTEHMRSMRKPVLVLQGERDPFGKQEEIEQYELSDQVTVQYIRSGEHSFKPLKSSLLSWEDNMQGAVAKAVHFIKHNLQ